LPENFCEVKGIPDSPAPLFGLESKSDRCAPFSHRRELEEITGDNDLYKSEKCTNYSDRERTNLNSTKRVWILPQRGADVRQLVKEVAIDHGDYYGSSYFNPRQVIADEHAPSSIINTFVLNHLAQAFLFFLTF
jgi:hypothetical protein